MQCNKNRCKQSCRSATEIRNGPWKVVFPSAKTHNFYSASTICATKDASCGSHPFYFTLVERFQITSYKRWPVATDTSKLTNNCPVHLCVCVCWELSLLQHTWIRCLVMNMFQACLCKAWSEVLQQHVDKNACCTTHLGDFSLTRDCGKCEMYSIFLRSRCGMPGVLNSSFGPRHRVFSWHKFFVHDSVIRKPANGYLFASLTSYHLVKYFWV